MTLKHVAKSRSDIDNVTCSIKYIFEKFSYKQRLIYAQKKVVQNIDLDNTFQGHRNMTNRVVSLHERISSMVLPFKIEVRPSRDSSRF